MRVEYPKRLVLTSRLNQKFKTMVRVYFESDNYAEQVATFQSEDIYNAMLPHLLEHAKKLGFDRVTEHLEEDWLQSAEFYLSGEDTEYQVMAIVNHADQSDRIDNVNGVFVWEPLEQMFTCSEFLEMIGYKG
jgi:hypothetical protein